MKRIFSAILFLSTITTLPLISENNLSEKIKKSYSSIKLFSASFKETIIPSFGEKQFFEGTLHIARPCSLRMEVLEPMEQLIIYNGNHIWFYFPEKNYCLKYDAKSEKNLSRIPGYIFKPFANLSIDTLYKTNNFIYIELSPNSEEELFTGIDLKISSQKLLPRAITLTDKMGNKTEYCFSNIEINNNKIIDFTFTPPESTKIIEKN
jgi:outer membrane lipoprotein carrier protein